MSALFLGIGAGVGWGVSDFLGGLAGRKGRLFAVLAFSQIAGLIVMLTLVAILTPPLLGGMASLWAVLAGLAGGAGVIALYRGLAVGSMSLIAPISALAVVVPVAAGLIQGERPAALVSAGILLAIIGSVMAGYAPGKATTTGVGMAVLAALGFGFGFVFIDIAAEEGALWAFTTSRIGSAVLIIGVAAATLGVPRLRRSVAVLASSAGAVEASAGLAFAAATTVGLLSVVAVLSSLYPAITLGLAFVVLGERLGGIQWVAVVLLLAGVAAIAAG